MYSKVNQLHIHIYALFFRIFARVGRYRELPVWMLKDIRRWRAQKLTRSEFYSYEQVIQMGRAESVRGNNSSLWLNSSWLSGDRWEVRLKKYIDRRLQRAMTMRLRKLAFIHISSTESWVSWRQNGQWLRILSWCDQNRQLLSSWPTRVSRQD